MNSNALLDAVKQHHRIDSDRALARILKISQASINNWRAIGLPDERVLQFATLLGIDPVSVMAAVHAERAKDPAVRKVWESLVKTLASRAAAALGAVGMLVCLTVGAPQPAEAAQNCPCYTLCEVQSWRRFWRFLRALAGKFSAPSYTLARGKTISMRGFAVFSLLIVCGCGSEAGQTNHGYGYDYDVSGVTGLRARYPTDQPQLPAVSNIEQLYQQVEACTGITASGPLIIFTHPIPTSLNYAPAATYLDTGTILVDTWISTDLTLTQVFQVYKHEFVHYLLHQSGFPDELNSSHQSQFFIDCIQ